MLKLFPLHTTFDQDLISFYDPPIPIKEHNAFSSPIGISLLKHDEDVPSILPNNPIEIQEERTFKEESNDLPPCENQSILLAPFPQQDVVIPPSPYPNPPYTPQDVIFF